MDIKICAKSTVNGTIRVPGDKSISHRAVMFGALSRGVTEIEGFLRGNDCLSTIDCFRKLGVAIDDSGQKVIVNGKGLHGLTKSPDVLDVGNSGTTIRLMLGILCAQDFETTITGDASIQKRPMDRVLIPLRQMGAQASGKEDGRFAPITLQGGSLKGIEYAMPVASAQVKSAILLASLYAQGTTTIVEPAPCRDHTEIMLNHLGANIKRQGNIITSTPVSELTARKIVVPGDISSAAYFITAALILGNSEIVVENTGTNPTRTGIVAALKQMGGHISIENETREFGEASGAIHASSSRLKAITLSGDIIPTMIDEVPIFAVAALFAEGRTVIKDAQELKVKESDRITAMVTELNKMGAHIQATDDGMIIDGGYPLKGAKVKSYGDHRIAMSLAIAALKAKGETEIEDAGCCNVSFPGFFELLNQL